jgi:hypothetical protein
MHSSETARFEPTIRWVVIVWLLYLEQEASRMLRHRQAECVMMTPGLGRAIGLAHILGLLSRIVGPEQQLKPKQ